MAAIGAPPVFSTRAFRIESNAVALPAIGSIPLAASAIGEARTSDVADPHPRRDRQRAAERELPG